MEAIEFWPIGFAAPMWMGRCDVFFRDIDE